MFSGDLYVIFVISGDLSDGMLTLLLNLVFKGDINFLM